WNASSPAAAMAGVKAAWSGTPPGPASPSPWCSSAAPSFWMTTSS
ncbi:hypothetical protein ATR1_220c0001, partial [Acetobacter tropicalis]